jgi:hypothetical protein
MKVSLHSSNENNNNDEDDLISKGSNSSTNSRLSRSSSNHSNNNNSNIITSSKKGPTSPSTNSGSNKRRSSKGKLSPSLNNNNNSNFNGTTDPFNNSYLDLVPFSAIPSPISRRHSFTSPLPTTSSSTATTEVNTAIVMMGDELRTVTFPSLTTNENPSNELSCLPSHINSEGSMMDHNPTQNTSAVHHKNDSSTVSTDNGSLQVLHRIGSFYDALSYSQDRKTSQPIEGSNNNKSPSTEQLNIGNNVSSLTLEEIRKESAGSFNN